MCNLFKFMNMFSSIFSLIHIQWKIILHMYMYTHSGVVYEKHTHTHIKRKQCLKIYRIKFLQFFVENWSWNGPYYQNSKLIRVGSEN